MRFLFVTIQGFESDFYGRVGVALQERGHEVAHLTASRLAAARLRRAGLQAEALQEVIARLTGRPASERRRIEEDYGLARLADLYDADPASVNLPADRADARALEHVLAVETVFDDIAPDVVVPEVGRELIRTVAHRVALQRRARTLFLFYTIFPQPLRLYTDSMLGQIAPPEDIRPLSSEEQRELDEFRESFIARDAPIRAHRRLGVTSRRLRRFVGYSLARIGPDRDNDYLHPVHWAVGIAGGWLRARRARRFYRDPEPGVPYVYFPLHDVEDYKIRQLMPQFADQAAIVSALAAALPSDFELVVKEHPQTIGHNPLSLFQRLSDDPCVRLVDPHTSTHDLIRGSKAIAVIGSTVGLEALLHGRPVLTLGCPFYAGYGATVDIDSVAEIPGGISDLLSFDPDRARIDEVLHAAMRACRSGAPVLVDDSDANALTLAGSIEDAASEAVVAGTLA